MRLRLLRELYEYYFANSGSWFKLINPEGEVNLAYKYFEGKGLIAYSDTYQQGSIMITTAGIEYIEKNTGDENTGK